MCIRDRDKYEVVIEFSEPEEKDDVPVVLRNNKFAEPVEGVIESYSLPGKGEIDPSMVVDVYKRQIWGRALAADAHFPCFFLTLSCISK